MDGKTVLVFVPGGGGLTADRYITDILAEHVVPYAGFIDKNIMLMQDHARCHTARVTSNYLSDVDITTINWPPLSPDLNPVKHIWDELKQRVQARNPAQGTIMELKAALVDE